MSEYKTLEECIQVIDEPNRSLCLKFVSDNESVLNSAKGSKSKHQAWEGGYLDHVAETMNIGYVLYGALVSTGRPLPFSMGDVYLVLFLHDVEKPFKQTDKSLGLESQAGIKDDSKIKDFKGAIIKKYGFLLSPEHENALRYAEGEGKDYDPHKRIQGPLAAFVHMCDTWSARGWHDFPKKRGFW